MNIAIIGTGNVGAALATVWSKAGHHIFLGTRDIHSFKGEKLLSNKNTSLHTVESAVSNSEIILIATPAPSTIEVTKSLGNTSEKIIIDAMNIVMNKGPQGYNNTSQAILDHTQTCDVVKCFNTTGYNNMADPIYNKVAIDMFMAGDSTTGKNAARLLAKDAGYAECYDAGGNEQFFLMEQFALFWINLALFRGNGREIAFKLLKRDS